MEHGVDAIKIAVAVIIIAVLVGLAFFVAKMGKNQVNSATAQLQSITSQFDEPDKLVYDGITSDGQAVIDAIDKFSEDDTVAIRVVHKNSNVDVYNGADIEAQEGTIAKTDTGKYNRSNARTDAKYINPVGSWTGSVQRNTDNVIVCITFTQVR